MHQIKNHRTRWSGIITLGVVLLLLSLFFLLREGQQPAPAAISKGSRLLDETAAWETAVYQNRTERLTMDGLVLFVNEGNNTCSVKLEQLGVMEAHNNTRDILEAGDRVTVQVNNNPVAY